MRRSGGLSSSRMPTARYRQDKIRNWWNCVMNEVSKRKLSKNQKWKNNLALGRVQDCFARYLWGIHPLPLKHPKFSIKMSQFTLFLIRITILPRKNAKTGWKRQRRQVCVCIYGEKRRQRIIVLILLLFTGCVQCFNKCAARRSQHEIT